MPNYVRWRTDGASYFFTVMTFGRRPLFSDERPRDILRRAFLEVQKRWPFEMMASVLMPNHLHCLWALPGGDDDFPIRWANIKRLFTRDYLAVGGEALAVSPNRHRHRERGIWQPRYWEHRIRDETDWYRHRDYIHYNPVKHGYVAAPREWPFSSIHRHIEQGWLDPNWPGSSPVAMIEIDGE